MQRARIYKSRGKYGAGQHLGWYLHQMKVRGAVIPLLFRISVGGLPSFLYLDPQIRHVPSFHSFSFLKSFSGSIDGSFLPLYMVSIVALPMPKKRD